jgi:hypothetical protein
MSTSTVGFGSGEPGAVRADMGRLPVDQATESEARTRALAQAQGSGLRMAMLGPENGEPRAAQPLALNQKEEKKRFLSWGMAHDSSPSGLASPARAFRRVPARPPP